MDPNNAEISPITVVAPFAPSEKEIGEKPWRYIGYRGFSNYIASDNDFSVFRRFTVTSTRVLLYMQDNITALEEDLSKLDNECMQRQDPEMDSGTFRHEPCVQRAETIHALAKALLEYSRSYAFHVRHFVLKFCLPAAEQFLSVHAELESRPPATKHSKTNVKNWLWNHPETILEAEADFVHRDDLINVVTRRKSPLHDFLLHTDVYTYLPFLKATREPANIDKRTVFMYSDARVDLVVTVLLLVLGLVMLIVPLWILDVIRNTQYRLAFISCAIVIFLLLISGLTAARPSEALAGTAAYVFGARYPCI